MQLLSQLFRRVGMLMGAIFTLANMVSKLKQAQTYWSSGSLVASTGQAYRGIIQPTLALLFFSRDWPLLPPLTSE